MEGGQRPTIFLFCFNFLENQRLNVESYVFSESSSSSWISASVQFASVRKKKISIYSFRHFQNPFSSRPKNNSSNFFSSCEIEMVFRRRCFFFFSLSNIPFFSFHHNIFQWFLVPPSLLSVEKVIFFVCFQSVFFLIIKKWGFRVIA